MPGSQIKIQILRFEVKNWYFISVELNTEECTKTTVMSVCLAALKAAKASFFKWISGALQLSFSLSGMMLRWWWLAECLIGSMIPLREQHMLTQCDRVSKTQKGGRGDVEELIAKVWLTSSQLLLAGNASRWLLFASWAHKLTVLVVVVWCRCCGRYRPKKRRKRVGELRL